MKNNQKGITLIALVVTIIVLLILAAVSISAVVGENGIATKAKKSKEETRGGSVAEARDLWKSNLEIEELENPNVENKKIGELVDSLVTQKLLTIEEKNEIMGNRSEGISAKGQITIGNKTIDFTNLDLYLSVRAIEKNDSFYIGIVCQIYPIPEYESNYTGETTTKGKETLLNKILAYTALQNGSTETIDLETYYEQNKDAILADEASGVEDYNDFVDYMYNQIAVGFTDIMEYTVISPDGSEFSSCSLKEFTFPVTEEGIYTIIANTADGEFIGRESIEYKQEKYLMTYNENYYCQLYDTELQDLVMVDEAYVHYNGTKTAETEKMIDWSWSNGNALYLYELNNQVLPFDIEFVKDGQSIIETMVAINEPS